MGLLSQKQIRTFRMFILSPNLEKYLLVTYIFSLLYIVGLKRNTLDGSGALGGPVHMSAYEFQQDLRQYFLVEEFEKITMNGTVDDIYAFIERLQTERIWLPAGERSPNWPVGLTRVVQHRVKTPAWCDHRGMSTTKTKDDRNITNPDKTGV
jgi:hypothetical protein